MTKKISFNEDLVLKHSPYIQSIKTDEGIIISRNDLKDDPIYYLDNTVSLKIWDLINGKNPLKKIKQDLLSEYDVNEEKLEKDLKKFIKELYLKKLIIYA